MNAQTTIHHERMLGESEKELVSSKYINNHSEREKNEEIKDQNELEEKINGLKRLLQGALADKQKMINEKNEIEKSIAAKIQQLEEKEEKNKELRNVLPRLQDKAKSTSGKLEEIKEKINVALIELKENEARLQHSEHKNTLYDQFKKLGSRCKKLGEDKKTLSEELKALTQTKGKTEKKIVQLEREIASLRIKVK